MANMLSELNSLLGRSSTPNFSTAIEALKDFGGTTLFTDKNGNLNKLGNFIQNDLVQDPRTYHLERMAKFDPALNGKNPDLMKQHIMTRRADGTYGDDNNYIDDSMPWWKRGLLGAATNDTYTSNVKGAYNIGQQGIQNDILQQYIKQLATYNSIYDENGNVRTEPTNAISNIQLDSRGLDSKHTQGLVDMLNKTRAEWAADNYTKAILQMQAEDSFTNPVNYYDTEDRRKSFLSTVSGDSPFTIDATNSFNSKAKSILYPNNVNTKFITDKNYQEQYNKAYNDLLPLFDVDNGTVDWRGLGDLYNSLGGLPDDAKTHYNNALSALIGKQLRFNPLVKSLSFNPDKATLYNFFSNKDNIQRNANAVDDLSIFLNNILPYVGTNNINYIQGSNLLNAVTTFSNLFGTENPLSLTKVQESYVDKLSNLLDFTLTDNMNKPGFKETFEGIDKALQNNPFYGSSKNEKLRQALARLYTSILVVPEARGQLLGTNLSPEQVKILDSSLRAGNIPNGKEFQVIRALSQRVFDNILKNSK